MRGQLDQHSQRGLVDIQNRVLATDLHGQTSCSTESAECATVGTSIDVESGFVAAAVAPRVAAKSAVSVNRVNSVLMREHGCVFRHAVAATTSVATIANE